MGDGAQAMAGADRASDAGAKERTGLPALKIGVLVMARTTASGPA